MKLFVWAANLPNGAYHEDGSAVVIASNVRSARRLLMEQRERNKRNNAGWEESYNWAEPAAGITPTHVIDLGECKAKEQVVARMVGCDC